MTFCIEGNGRPFVIELVDLEAKPTSDALNRTIQTINRGIGKNTRLDVEITWLAEVHENRSWNYCSDVTIVLLRSRRRSGMECK